MINKPKFIIVEGAQGVGKTTITRLIRERLTYSVLISLTGTKDKTKAGESKVFREHNMSLNMVDNCDDCDINFVFDRSFITERNYCMLGIKEFDFKTSYDHLLDRLNHIAENYDTYLLVLMADAKTFEERLKRDKPQFLNVQFNPDMSLRQQQTYLQLSTAIKRTHPNIKVSHLSTIGRDPNDIVTDILSVI